jgi:DNA polymerase III alpha subunit
MSINLHTHSVYSVGDSTCSIDDLAKFGGVIAITLKLSTLMARRYST